MSMMLKEVVSTDLDGPCVDYRNIENDRPVLSFLVPKLLFNCHKIKPSYKFSNIYRTFPLIKTSSDHLSKVFTLL